MRSRLGDQTRKMISCGSCFSPTTRKDGKQVGKRNMGATLQRHPGRRPAEAPRTRAHWAWHPRRAHPEPSREEPRPRRYLRAALGRPLPPSARRAPPPRAPALPSPALPREKKEAARVWESAPGRAVWPRMRSLGREGSAGLEDRARVGAGCGARRAGRPGAGASLRLRVSPRRGLVYTCVHARRSCLFSRKFLAVGEWTVIGLGVRPQGPRGDEKELEL